LTSRERAVVRVAPLFQRVAVLGVGLIGGSVAAAARASGVAAELVGYAPGGDAHHAQALGLIDTVAPDPASAAQGSDLVVIAAPIPALSGLLGEIAARLAPHALVTDTASTKRSVIEAARAAMGPAFARFVAAHPIAGAETHGPAAARAELFEGCVALLCPEPETDPLALERVAQFWSALGARVAQMGAGRHDRLFAEVSHWPHAAVFALCGAIASGPQAEEALRFAGAGLRDTTRIGASSAALWADILLDNREAVLDCAQAFERELRAMIDALRGEDRQALIERFETASRWRRRLT
jgi:prephenate dehydrogenase